MIVSRARRQRSQLANKDDTDFDVDQLYSFTAELGLTTIKANYNRWFVDLNRQQNDKALYNDGRSTTSLFPTRDFAKRPIYKERDYKISDEEAQTITTVGGAVAYLSQTSSDSE